MLNYLDDWYSSKKHSARPTVPVRPRHAVHVHFHDVAHVFVGALDHNMVSHQVPVGHLSAWLQQCDQASSIAEEPLSLVSSPSMHALDSHEVTFSKSTSPFDFVVLHVPDEPPLDDEVADPPADCHDCHLVDAPTWHSDHQVPESLDSQCWQLAWLVVCFASTARSFSRG